MNEPPLAISDYALIGNGQTAALVGRNGSIDWCCWPRFDSAAVFCRLLDEQRGGHFQIAPIDDYRWSREYVEATNVLQTVFTTPGGIVRLTDMMPAPSEDGDRKVFPHRILRKVECLEGQVELHVGFRPSFDYARTPPRYELHRQGAIAYGNGEALSSISPWRLHNKAESLATRVALTGNDAHWFVLTHGPPADARHALQFSTEDAESEYQRTIEYWKRWSETCQYNGPYRAQVLRSALVLKLLAFQPTGGLVAAPTAALPAEIGGQRNWDYRYTWLRDSGLLLDSLQQLGYHEESVQFIDWLENLCLACEGDLRVLYAVDGQPAPDEQPLEHLSGYRNSTPVRIGNGAVDQTQIDNYGHILDAVVLCYERMPREVKPQLWQFLRDLANRTAQRWDEPDKGPWELRQPPAHHLYSKLYCWVALDRAIRFADQHGLPGTVREWERQRDAIREAILSRGYNADVEAFTQSFGSTDLDASVLTVPLVGLLPPDDERVRSTLRAVQDKLTADGLAYRYRIDDGLPGSDATFTLCSFWVVMNLALTGNRVEAHKLFEHICSFANDVGLLSEQIDPASGELLGNFPQGFTHLGLIRAALHLQEDKDQE